MEQTIYKIFIKKNGCLKCHEILKTLKDSSVEFQIYDIDTVDGLTEASYYGVLSTPTIVEVDEGGEEVERWFDLKDIK